MLLAMAAPGNLASASAYSGAIDPGAFRAQVCHNPACVSPVPGTINFRPTGTLPVTVDDNLGIDGLAWGNELGWITFDPSGPEGLTIDPTTGLITGKAWSQVAGWINFSPTGQSVSIDATGAFVGWAWAGGPMGGWIRFDCAVTDACVRTDWRPVSGRATPPPVGGVGGNGPTAGSAVGGSPADQCWNLEGLQSTVPPGLLRVGNDCAPPEADLCPNLPGPQSTLPARYTRDEGGLCYLVVDHCPNLPDVQYTIPGGWTVGLSGDCALIRNPDPTDTADAPHLPGKPSLHSATPPDLVTENLITLDRCPNLGGAQAGIPTGFVVDEENACVPATLDYCPNIEGKQTKVPAELVIEDSGDCAPYRVSGRPDLSKASAVAPGDEPAPVRPSDTRPIGFPLLLIPAVLVSLALITLLWLLLTARSWGRVLDAETGAGLPGARLLLYDEAGRQIAETFSRAHGRYRFRVPRGAYHLRAELRDYRFQPLSTRRTLYDGGVIEVSWTGRASLDVALRRADVT